MAESSGSKSLLWIVLVLVLGFLILWAIGVFDFSAEGEVEMPDVDISAEGGELPDVDADVADIDVGTEEVTVEVPDVDVDAADADEE